MATERIGIVATRFHPEIMDPMLEEALAKAKELGVTVTKVCRVPGSFDLPLLAQQLLRREDVDGVVTLGALVTGETDHDQLIAYAAAEALTRLSLEYKKPVTLGITGPQQTYEQAVARIPRAGEIVESCVHMIRELRDL
ncbi:MAG: 6,7-dimethyl-8-ribityllumazine synthase [Candidatus Aenigmarchaeota archaeon]|nr:6,7-dimethyl-8-ribityllumazine synthase [Candidatus Aenigmarchaeota archaeon]